MTNRFSFRILIGLAIVAALVSAGFYGYNLGVARGIAEVAQLVGATGTAAPIIIYGRPWGWGFGFFPFFPLLFILFWVFAIRGLFWRRGWRGRACGYGRYDNMRRDDRVTNL